jgi:nicotinamidase-related amidase
MATIRKGEKSILLVVDAQVGVMQGAWEETRIINNIATVVEKARKANIPVIWVQHEDEELKNGSAAWQIVPQLTPAEGEVKIYKHFNSSFEETSLDETLSDLGATHIVLAGAVTNWCIRATAYAALDRGYDLTLVKDAHTTETTVLKDGSKIEASGIITDLNISMAWLSYPGRKNAAEKAEEINFVV